MSLNECIEKWTPLVRKIASKRCLCSNTLGSYDDMVQEGLLAIWRIAKKYPKVEGKEKKNLYIAGVCNAMRNVVDKVVNRNKHKANYYSINLDEFIGETVISTKGGTSKTRNSPRHTPLQLMTDGGMGELFFEYAVVELRKVLTPVSNVTVSLLNKPTKELMEIVSKDYCNKNRSRRVLSYKILKKHLAEYFGIPNTDMTSIFKEIQLTVELNPSLI